MEWADMLDLKKEQSLLGSAWQLWVHFSNIFRSRRVATNTFIQNRKKTELTVKKFIKELEGTGFFSRMDNFNQRPVAIAQI